MGLCAGIFRLLALFVTVASLVTVNGKSVSNSINPKEYLIKYGYLTETFGFIPEISEGIRRFQSFFGLNQTGTLNKETIRAMEAPRCGVSDEISFKTTRSKRYVLHGSKWPKSKLTYKISNYPNTLKQSVVNAEIKRAFAVWSEVTNLVFSFKEKYEEADIEIGFYKGQHEDETDPDDAFDGPDGTLAHAFFPQYGGDIHFDDDELWTAGGNRGFNLFITAVHEIGHALGLKHSKVQTAVMAPKYRYSAYFQLDPDDVKGIQEIYGAKSTVQSKEDSMESEYSQESEDTDVFWDSEDTDIFEDSDSGFSEDSDDSEYYVDSVYLEDASWDLDELSNHLKNIL